MSFFVGNPDPTPFLPETLKDWAGIISESLTALGIIVAGVWAAWRFRLFREKHARIEFNLGCRYIHTQGDQHVLELSATMQNKGLARQYINRQTFTFNLLTFDSESEIQQDNSAINFQVQMTPQFSNRNWMPSGDADDYTFIDAGTTQTYTYLTAVPSGTTFITIYSRFVYPNMDEYHAAQSVFSIKQLIQNSEG